jgi:serine phosphatase RsbU (regulator of sigma subunit)
MAVADADDVRLDLRGLLAAVEAAPPVEAVDVLAAELARMLDATEVSLIIANLSGTAAVRMSHATVSQVGVTDGANERTESLTLDDSVHHRVLRRQEQHVEPHCGGWRVLVPVTERGDAMGILELTVPRSPDADTLGYVRSAAHALAYTLIASRRHTDLFEWTQRDVPFSLAAEIQRRLLPASYTVEGGPFTLAGWLEPEASVGGDTFDYSVDREYLYASVTDAMGHSTRAAVLATLTVGSLRNTRRSVASPAEQADAANAALMAGAAPEQFVTGQILRIRLAAGAVDIVNAGHPPPYLLRAGAAAVLEVTPSLPLGVARDPYGAQRLALEAGDRVLIATDGFSNETAISPLVTSSSTPRTGTPAKSSASRRGTCSPPPAAICATTPPSSASTGSGRAAFATPPEAPASIGLRATDRRSPLQRVRQSAGTSPVCGSSPPGRSTTC